MEIKVCVQAILWQNLNWCFPLICGTSSVSAFLASFMIKEVFRLFYLIISWSVRGISPSVAPLLKQSSSILLKMLANRITSRAHLWGEQGFRQLFCAGHFLYHDFKMHYHILESIWSIFIYNKDFLTVYRKEVLTFFGYFLCIYWYTSWFLAMPKHSLFPFRFMNGFLFIVFLTNSYFWLVSYFQYLEKWDNIINNHSAVLWVCRMCLYRNSIDLSFVGS